MTEPLIVVGGGAAGMMAAGRAAELGASVLLLEKQKHLGSKLRITGKGRCNLTNTAAMRDFVARFGPNGRFLYRAFTEFFHQDLRAFFDAAGVRTVVERGQRVFPYSNKALDVVQALEGYVRRHGVQIECGSPVRDLVAEQGRIVGVEMIDNDEGVRWIPASVVVLATGGASYPLTGSTGDGYRMAAQLGHRIVPIKPALVPLEIKESWVPDLQGLSLRNVRATLYLNDEPQTDLFGEMLFTHFGISGPIILTMSGQAVQLLGQGRIQVGIDLKPALDDEQLDARLQRDFDEQGKRTFRNILKGLIPLKMRDVFVALTGIPSDTPGHQINSEQRQRLFHQLRDLRVTVIGARPIDEAIITAGGVHIDDVDPRTMESKVVQGLYLCGEVIDVDADTGGYNLQAAFSTGRLAGASAAGRWRELIA